MAWRGRMCGLVNGASLSPMARGPECEEGLLALTLGTPSMRYELS